MMVLCLSGKGVELLAWLRYLLRGD